jgi:hypothetical protein
VCIGTATTTAAAATTTTTKPTTIGAAKLYQGKPVTS